MRDMRTPVVGAPELAVFAPCKSLVITIVFHGICMIDRSVPAAVRVFEPAQLLPLIPEPASQSILPDWVA